MPDRADDCVTKPTTSGYYSRQHLGPCILYKRCVTNDFEVDGNQIGTSGADGSFNWDTSGWSASDHVINIRVSDNVAGQIKSRSQTYLLTAGAPPPPTDVTCSIGNFGVSPSPPQPAGTTVNITATADCNTGVRAMRIRIDGGIVFEIGAPSIFWSWNTGGLSGQHTILVEAAGNQDNDWTRRTERSTGFSFDMNSGQNAAINGVTFSTKVIQIGNDVFVIVDGSRRLVPNPQTLDALGITRDWINNKGLSESDLNAIPRGPDIPDVTVDPGGFNAFKSLTSHQQTRLSIIQTIPVHQINHKHRYQMTCVQIGGTDISVGMIAVITVDGLNVRSRPGLDQTVMFICPVEPLVSVISGPQCKDSHRWWEIGTNGQSGWSSEIGFDPNTTNSPVVSATNPVTQPEDNQTSQQSNTNNGGLVRHYQT